MRGRKQQNSGEWTDYSESGDRPGDHSPSAILMEASTGTVICENADEPKPGECHEDHDADPDLRCPAVRKIHLTDEVVTSAHAKSMGGSQVFLEEGEVQTVETLIKCIVIASGNDASVAIGGGCRRR